MAGPKKSNLSEAEKKKFKKKNDTILHYYHYIKANGAIGIKSKYEKIEQAQ